MKNFLLAIIFLTSGALAQTISPVWIEGGKGKASGDVTLTNNYLMPVTSTIEAVSVHIIEGKPIPMATLDPGISVRLANGSARIAPKDSHEFSYKVQCAQIPCFVTFLIATTVGHTNEGLALTVMQNSSVYLCQKAKDCRRSIFQAAGVTLPK